MEIELFECKVLFGQKLLECVVLVVYICVELDVNEDGEICEEYVLCELEVYFKFEEVECVFKIGIEWGCYGEVYEYVYNIGMLILFCEECEECEECEVQEGGDNVG